MPEINLVDAVRQINQDFSAYLGRGDAQALAELYSQEAKLMPPGSDFVTGRQAIQAFWKGVMDAGISGAELVTVELHSLGSMAVELGTYTLRAGDAVVDFGKYMVLWRQEGLRWRLYRDTWNTSAAAAQASGA